MAASAIDVASLELANALPVEEIPTKLRCANCNRLAIDAVKLPCCDNAVCLACSEGLPETCPVCDHSPVDVTDLKPHKGLRTTIKVWLRNELGKRNTSGGMPGADSTETPAPSNPAEQAPAPETKKDLEPLQEDAVDGATYGEPESSATPAIAPTEAPVTEEAPTETAADAADQEEEEEDEEDNVIITTERPESELENGATDNVEGAMEMEMEQDSVHVGGPQQGFGNNTGFGMNGGFNPMMNMGMGMPGFGNMPNMMGMPGIGNMDPAAMMSMMGGMGGMDMMSGMMGGMGPMGGMGGFGGGMGPNMGMGFNGPNGFNNQNFGNPNFGPNFPHRGFGRGRGFRGNRGGFGYNRGRGGYGYGTINFGPQQGHGTPNMMNQQPPSFGANGQASGQAAQPGRRGSPNYEPINMADGSAANASLHPRDSEAADPSDDANRAGTTKAAATDGEAAQTGDGEEILNSREIAESAGENAHGEQHDGVEFNGEGEMQPQTLGDGSMASNINGSGQSAAIRGSQYQDAYYDQSFQQGFGYGPNGRGGFRGGRGGLRGGRGSFFGPGGMTEAKSLTPAPAPPANAPSGPKAMREGKPNTGYYSRPQPTPSVPPPAQPTPQPEKSQEHVEHEKSHERSSSRSRERHSRKDKHRDDGYESSEDRRRKQEERRRRKDKDRREEKYADEDLENYSSSRKDRSRERSSGDDYSARHRPKEDERRPSRSRRDRSREREKRRRRQRSRSADEASVNGDDYERSYRKRKGDRSRYDDEEDDFDRTRDKGRSRRHSRRRDAYESKDRSRRHARSSYADSKERDRDHDKNIRPAEDDEIGFKIKGSRSATLNPSGMAPPSKRERDRDLHDRRTSDAAPAALGAGDPYKEERDRMQAARIAKEQERQRRQSTSALGKRMSRDDDEEAFGTPRGPKGSHGREGGRRRKERKINVRYEDELPR